MINVDDKPLTKRVAVAEGYVKMNPKTLDAILEGKIKKGDAICVSKVAGISGAKLTPTLIPMCHPIPLSDIEIEIKEDGKDKLRVEATIVATWKTGVEMEALAAVSIACLSIYDMCKYMDKGMVLEGIRLIYKNGGKSGEFKAN